MNFSCEEKPSILHWLLKYWEFAKTARSNYRRAVFSYSNRGHKLEKVAQDFLVFYVSSRIEEIVYK